MNNGAALNKPIVAADEEDGRDGAIFVTHDFERGREAEILLHIFTESDVLARRFTSPLARRSLRVMKAMGTTHSRKHGG